VNTNNFRLSSSGQFIEEIDDKITVSLNNVNLAPLESYKACDEAEYSGVFFQVFDREWERNTFTFDNVPQAMLTLVVVMTFEGWPR
jgi:hypothetical protein